MHTHTHTHTRVHKPFNDHFAHLHVQFPFRYAMSCHTFSQSSEQRCITLLSGGEYVRMWIHAHTHIGIQVHTLKLLYRSTEPEVLHFFFVCSSEWT